MNIFYQRLDIAKERINELEDGSENVIQNIEKQIGKKQKRGEES